MWITPSAGQQFEPLFVSASERHGLPDGLLSRVAYQESMYDPQAFNATSGASGIMQIVPRFHPGVDAWNPTEAIPYAASYLRQMFDRFGNWALALAAYNAGPTNVERYGGIPPFRETINYVNAILRDLTENIQAKPWLLVPILLALGLLVTGRK